MPHMNFKLPRSLFILWFLEAIHVRGWRQLYFWAKGCVGKFSQDSHSALSRPWEVFVWNEYLYESATNVSVLCICCSLQLAFLDRKLKLDRLTQVPAGSTWIGFAESMLIWTRDNPFLHFICVQFLLNTVIFVLSLSTSALLPAAPWGSRWCS